MESINVKLIDALEDLHKEVKRSGIGTKFFDGWKNIKKFFKKYEEYDLINSALASLKNEENLLGGFFVNYWKAQIKTNLFNLREKLLKEEEEKKEKERKEKEKEEKEEKEKEKEEKEKKEKERKEKEEEEEKKKEEEEEKKKEEEERSEALKIIQKVFKTKENYNLEEMVKGVLKIKKEAESTLSPEMINKFKEITDRINNLETENQKKEKRINNLETENEEKEKRIKKLETKIEEKEKRIKKLETKIEEKEKRIKKLETENEEKENEINKLRGENSKLNKNLKDVQDIVSKMNEEESKNKKKILYLEKLCEDNNNMLKKCFIRDVFKKILKKIENRKKEGTDLEGKYKDYEEYLLQHKNQLNKEIHCIQFSQVNNSTYKDNLLGHVEYSMSFYNDLPNNTKKVYLDLTKAILP